MNNTKQTIQTLISGITAGIIIGLGGTAYLASDNKMMGALLFSVGLLTICIFELKLYTGKVGYVIEKKNVLEIAIIFIGNCIGVIIMGEIIRIAGLTTIFSNIEGVVETKLNRSWLNILVLAILCNVCIYIAVEGYKRIKNSGKYVIVILGVMVFVICGFEHSIADIFYFTVYGWSLDMVIDTIIIVIGNAVGGIGINTIIKLSSKKVI